MKHPRVFVPGALVPGEVRDLPEDAANHLRVLRLPPGNPVTLFNGDGGEFEAELVSVEKRRVSVRVGAFIEREAESPLALTLVQGVSKGERMDYTIQKAVELGVSAVLPVFTQRSVVQLDGDRLARREAHWQAIIASACEQCGRNRLPRLLPARPLERAWTEIPAGRQLVLDPLAESGLGGLLPLDKPVVLLVGPEGGLTDQEIEAARGHGFVGVRLGPRILRTETAGIAAIAALQSLAGDLG